MLPLAEACDFKSGSFQSESGSRLHKWDEADRAEFTAELDAALFHLYGLERDNVEYILCTFAGIHDRGTVFPDQGSPEELNLWKSADMAGST
jgi:hypothetical protein